MCTHLGIGGAESCCGVCCAVTSLKFRVFGYLLGSLAGLYGVLYFLMLFSIGSVLDVFYIFTNST